MSSITRDLPECCSICHKEGDANWLTLVEAGGDRITRICSAACFATLRALQCSMKRLQHHMDIIRMKEKEKSKEQAFAVLTKPPVRRLAESPSAAVLETIDHLKEKKKNKAKDKKI